MKIGIDMAEISRFELWTLEQKYLNRVFTANEQEHILEHHTKQGKMERIAGKFCAKEAVAKAFGTGIGGGVSFREIEILPDELGKPTVTLWGETKQKFQKIGYTSIEISITHDAGLAMCSCIINQE